MSVTRMVFVFIVQDHGCKDPLHLVEQGNVKLEKLTVSMLTPQINQMNFYSDISKQSVPASISFSFKEDDFPLLTNVCRPVSKSGNCSNHVNARSIVVSSNVSGLFVSM